jgi:hypothetical protein
MLSSTARRRLATENLRLQPRGIPNLIRVRNSGAWYQAPDWRPRQSNIDQIDLEIIKARQRAPGSIDSHASGIGIGPFAREAMPARSGNRVWTEEERLRNNENGDQNGWHTCGTREPGTIGGNFILDHQSPTRLNPPGQNQIILPQCLSCSVRQGGLISSAVRREKP